MAIALPFSPPTWPFWSAVGTFIAENAVAIAVGVVGAGAITASQMTKADSEATEKDKAGTKTVTCATCKDNPCASLASGVPGSPYRGGAAGGLRGTVGDKLSPHHTPADSASHLPWAVGPAVQMDEADHKLTASYGSSASARAYQQAQKKLIDSGNFMAAQAMDIADLAQFSPKYDNAIAQMEAYTLCLKRNGIIK